MKLRGSGGDSFSVATAFVGTLVGAGFSSGQELTQFFAGFGIAGFAGIALATAGFYLLATMAMIIARRRRTANFEDVIAPPTRWMRILAGCMVSFFSLSLLPAMFAGTGTLLAGFFGGNTLPGTVVMALAVIVVGLFGQAGLLSSFRFVVPLMIAASLLLGLFGMLFPAQLPPVSGAPTAVSHWMLSAMLFVSYNTVGVIAVLSPIGFSMQSVQSVRRGALSGAMITGAMAALLCGALLRNPFYNTDMSLYAIAAQFGRGWGVLYGGVLLVAIFTTAASIVFALTERLSRFASPLLSRRPLTVTVIVGISLAASRLGFSALVEMLYPISGYLGFWIIGCLVWNYLCLKDSRIP